LGFQPDGDVRTMLHSVLPASAAAFGEATAQTICPAAGYDAHIHIAVSLERLTYSKRLLRGCAIQASAARKMPARLMEPLRR